MSGDLVSFWLSCMPITHDMEEALGMNVLLAELVINYELISSLNNQAGIGSTLATIFGEGFDDKYFFYDDDDDKTAGKAAKLKVANAVK